MKKKRNSKIQNAARGNSLAARNRKLRRDVLREELKAREYIRQLLDMAGRLDPGAKDAYQTDQVPTVKARADILQRLLDKCLPNLRPVDIPVTFELEDGTPTDQARATLAAMADGQITPVESAAILPALAGQARILESDELEKRIARLEKAHAH